LQHLQRKGGNQSSRLRLQLQAHSRMYGPVCSLGCEKQNSAFAKLSGQMESIGLSLGERTTRESRRAVGNVVPYILRGRGAGMGVENVSNSPKKPKRSRRLGARGFALRWKAQTRRFWTWRSLLRVGLANTNEEGHILGHISLCVGTLNHSMRCAPALLVFCAQLR
jgi:hypothetical protein